MNSIWLLQSITLVTALLLSSCVARNPSTKPTISAQAVNTESPNSTYQLTYVSKYVADGTTYQGIFASDVQCLDQEMPCFGSPQLMLSIPEQSDGNPDEPYGQILAYSWSPDGNKIAFSAFSNRGEMDIFVADWDGQNLRNITGTIGSELYPSWSKDNQLLYIGCSEGRCDGYISDGSGGNVEGLPMESPVSFATWMPDGKSILFMTVDDHSFPQIFVSDSKGVNIKQVTHATENDMVDDAATDGNLIFFARLQTPIDKNFNYNIFSIDISGASESQITTDENLISTNPSVAPFGSWLAFEQGREKYNIYVSSFDGKQLLQVTDDQQDNRLPEWRVLATH